MVSRQTWTLKRSFSRKTYASKLLAILEEKFDTNERSSLKLFPFAVLIIKNNSIGT